VRLKHFESTQQCKETIYDGVTPQKQILKHYDVLHCMRSNLSPSLKPSSLYTCNKRTPVHWTVRHLSAIF